MWSRERAIPHCLERKTTRVAGEAKAVLPRRRVPTSIQAIFKAYLDDRAPKQNGVNGKNVLAFHENGLVLLA